MFDNVLKPDDIDDEIRDNDNDDEDDSQYLIWSQYSCPKCETILNVYWSEKDGKG